MLSKTEITSLEKQLKQRETELMNQLKDHFGQKYEFSKEVSGELSNYDNHPGDLGTELFERSKDLALNEHAEKELEDINEALHAIEEGSYGICSECGKDIPYERLEVVPTTDRCVEHTEKNGDTRDRPVEEEVLNPNITHSRDGDEEQNAYDEEDAWQEVSRYGTSDSPSDLMGDPETYNEMYPNADNQSSGTEDIENYVSSDEEGKYNENTLNYSRNKNKE
ncbi:TraR/DksA C4-type zinc finger protein [Oceanobacillus sp. CAU 1775]